MLFAAILKISNNAEANILSNQYLILFATFCQKLWDLWEHHWQVWPMSLKLTLADYLPFSQALSDSICQVWWVWWSLNNLVSAIFNPQSILQKYQPVSTCICQCLSQLCCMCLCKLKTTCPESCCLYFMNIIIVESSLLPFHSSFIFPPVSHFISQSMANF